MEEVYLPSHVDRRICASLRGLLQAIVDVDGGQGTGIRLSS